MRELRGFDDFSPRMDLKRKKHLTRYFFLLAHNFNLVEFERMVEYLETTHPEWNKLDEGSQFVALSYQWFLWYGNDKKTETLQKKYRSLFNDFTLTLDPRSGLPLIFIKLCENN